MKPRTACAVRPLGLLLAAGVLAAACGEISDAEQLRPQAARADSAGVTILTSDAPRWSAGTADAWTIAPEPDLQIGAVDGPPEQLLTGPVAVGWIGDSLMVAEPHEIRLYAPDGELTRTLGGRGEGPGEFRMVLNTALPCGRQILATEITGTRVVSLDSDGQHRSIPVPGAVGTSRLPGVGVTIHALPLEGCLPGGALTHLGSPPSTASDPPSAERPPLHLIRVGVEDASTDTLMSVPGAEYFGAGRLPFGRRTLVAARDSLLHLVDTGRTEVRIHTLEGELRTIIRLGVPRRPLTAEELDRYRAGRVASAPEARRDALAQQLDLTPFPDTLPWASELQIAPDGSLWLQEYRPPWESDDAPSTWLVVSPEGAWLGSVELPRDLRRVSVGPDAVAGVWHDDLDVAYVRRYPLRPR